MAASRKPLLIAAFLLFASPCWGDVAIRGVVWSTPAEARRAARARVEIAAEQVKPRPSLYPAVARPESAPPPRGKITPMPVLRVQPGMRETVVYVEAIPDKVERKLDQAERKSRERPNYRIILTDSRYSPRVTAVAMGSLVEIQNLDDIWHNTFSVSRAKSFDVGKIRPGSIDSVLFDHAGIVNLHCDIHPKEIGFVMVAPNHAFARPDSLGQFDLPKLPRGRYRIRLWHPTLGEGKLEIDLPKRGTFDLDLAFQ